jgi:hypothetical protein
VHGIDIDLLETPSGVMNELAAAPDVRQTAVVRGALQALNGGCIRRKDGLVRARIRISDEAGSIGGHSLAGSSETERTTLVCDAELIPLLHCANNDLRIPPAVGRQLIPTT